MGCWGWPRTRWRSDYPPTFVECCDSSSDACSRLRMLKAGPQKPPAPFFFASKQLVRISNRNKGSFDSLQLEPQRAAAAASSSASCLTNSTRCCSSVSPPPTGYLLGVFLTCRTNTRGMKTQKLLVCVFSPEETSRLFPSAFGKRLTKKECMLLVGPELGG